MKFEGGVTLCIFFLGLFPARSGGQVLRVSSEVTCGSCGIDLRHVGRLSDPDGRITGRPVALTRASDGSVYLIDQQARVPYVFDEVGRFVQQIGRRGAGPGEYQDARAVLIDNSNRTLHILDPTLNRRTVVSSDGTVVRTIPLSATSSTPFMASAALLPGSGLVVNRLMLDPQSAGFAIEEVDREGRRVGVYDEGPMDLDAQHRLVRLLFAEEGGEIWAAEPYHYVVRWYSADRKSTKTLEREHDWFRPLAPGEKASGGQFERPPSMTMAGVWTDEVGVLWTATNIPSSRWRPGPTFGEWRAGAPIGQPIYDAMVEAIDPRTGALIASARFDQELRYVLGSGYMASYEELDDGTPVVDVWRVQLNRGR